MSDVFHWSDLLPVRDEIDRRTRAINHDYSLVFGNGPARIGSDVCKTGYTDFSQRRCWVNASALDLTPEEQYVATVLLAAHERAHARYTEYDHTAFIRSGANDRSNGTRGRLRAGTFDHELHIVTNVLEDERIERRLEQEFPFLRDVLQEGSRLFLTVIAAATNADSRGEVLTHILRRRVATRAGVIEECPLNTANIALLSRCEPFVAAASTASSFAEVVRAARAILRILKLRAKDAPSFPVLSRLYGQREEGDTSLNADEEQGIESVDHSDPLELEGEGQPNSEEDRARSVLVGSGYSPGKPGWNEIPLAPYDELLRSVRPRVSRMRPLFQRLQPRPRVALEASGGRLSLRAARTTPQTPFRLESIADGPNRVALTVVLDDSGSMYGLGEAEAKRLAMLCVEALPTPHRVRVVLTPHGAVLASPEWGEISRARIAGYQSRSGTRYSTVLKRELQLLKQTPRSFCRLLIVVGDGITSPADAAACVGSVRNARRAHVETMGIAVGIDPKMVRFFVDVFKDQFVGVPHFDLLLPRLEMLMHRLSRRIRLTR